MAAEQYEVNELRKTIELIAEKVNRLTDLTNAHELEKGAATELRTMVQKLKLQLDMLEGWLKAMEQRVLTIEHTLARHLENRK